MASQHRSFGISIEEASRRREEEERDVLFTATVAGREVTFYKPNASELVVLATVVESSDSATTRMGQALNVITGMLSVEDRAHVLKAIRIGALDLDSDPDTGEPGLIDLLTAIVEEAGARPTPPSSASSPSPRSGGRSSTATSRRVRSTPSR